MFEYDSAKSTSNKQKHGIDFETACQLWLDPNRIIIPARVVGETRFLLIAKLNKDVLSAIYTEREDNIRIISVRKARTNEREIYFK